MHERNDPAAHKRIRRLFVYVQCTLERFTHAESEVRHNRRLQQWRMIGKQTTMFAHG
jgi:hypothetical protein